MVTLLGGQALAPVASRKASPVMTLPGGMLRVAALMLNWKRRTPDPPMGPSWALPEVVEAREGGTTMLVGGVNSNWMAGAEVTVPTGAVRDAEE